MTEAEQCRAIRGPVSTVIHSLLRLGWNPAGASTWSYQAGPGRVDEWQFPDSVYEQNKVVSHKALLEDIEEAAELKVWATAAKHYCGAGVEDGVDCRPFRELLNHISCLDNGKRMAEILVMIAAGGCWPNDRKKAEFKRHARTAECDRCGEADETPLH
eukprot:7586777-Pyramimonas_sp.AAC.1